MCDFCRDATPGDWVLAVIAVGLWLLCVYVASVV